MIIKATLAKPGIVLKRPVGSKQRFSEHAHLPKDLPSKTASPRTPAPARKTKTKPASKSDDKAARKAAIKYEREELKRDRQRRAPCANVLPKKPNERWKKRAKSMMRSPMRLIVPATRSISARRQKKHAAPKKGSPGPESKELR